MNYRRHALLEHEPGTDRPVVYEGMRTPWGDAQEAQIMLPGIGSVSTAGHGGIKLDADRNRMVPEYLRAKGGWYEEDCEWAIPFCVFERELRTVMPRGFENEIHKRTLANWFPAQYQRFYGVTLDRSQSIKLDEEMFHQEHVNDWVTISAWGDWQPGVPSGFVGVCATLGGSRGVGQERWFLVPRDGYQNNRSHGFVIDPIRHAEIASLTGHSR